VAHILAPRRGRIKRRPHGQRSALPNLRALRLHASKESREVDHEALVRAPGDELDLVDRLGLEGDPASLDGNDTGFNP
jgi:hypothetical protein